MHSVCRYRKPAEPSSKPPARYMDDIFQLHFVDLQTANAICREFCLVMRYPFLHDTCATSDPTETLRGRRAYTYVVSAKTKHAFIVCLHTRQLGQECPYTPGSTHLTIALLTEMNPPLPKYIQKTACHMEVGRTLVLSRSTYKRLNNLGPGTCNWLYNHAKQRQVEY
jgi:hypothetical protein